MFSSGAMERVTSVDRLYQSEEASRPPVGNASWRGFLVSVFKDTASTMVLTGGLVTCFVGTWIGIRERSPEIYISLPVITSLAGALYFGAKGYLYVKRSSHGEGDTLATMPDRVPVDRAGLNAAESAHLLNGRVSCSANSGRVANPERTVTDMDFLKELEHQYFGSDGMDFEFRITLFQELKDRFPDYFSKHPTIKEQYLLEDTEQCRTIVEGIFKCYRHKLNTQDQYQISETTDHGDCLYDALWQGVPPDKKTQLLNQFQEELTALAVRAEGESDPYLVLKVILNNAADKDQYREMILKNGKSQGLDSYTTINDYKRKIMDKGLFWGRHGIEGWILAKELDCNLVLIPGCDYIHGVGFVDRDAQTIFESRTAKTTLYVDNRFLHYSAAEKKTKDSRNGVAGN